MATTKMIPLPEGANLADVVSKAVTTLQEQGYDVVSTLMGENAANITVSKDNDGIKKFIGLGLESRVNVMRNGNSLTLTIEGDWVFKWVAVGIGWFLCFVPFITGIIGMASQSSLPNKINDAFMMAVNN